MDSLLQQRAIEVLFSGVERTEVQEDGQVYLFFPRMDIGPYTSQARPFNWRRDPSLMK